MVVELAALKAEKMGTLKVLTKALTMVVKMADTKGYLREPHLA